jgi:hypothetical protein
MITNQAQFNEAVQAFNLYQSLKAHQAAQELRDRLYPQPEQTQHQLDIDALFV